MRVVNVDVYVEDQKGRPVFGLKHEDFELYEDGVPVTIQFFSAARQSGEKLVVHAPSVREGSTIRQADPLEVSRPDPDIVRVVIYLDNSGLHPGHRQRIVGELRKFASERPRAIQVAIATYDSGLKFLTGFEDPLEDVAAALEAVGHQPAGGAAIERDFIVALDRFQTLYRKWENTTLARLELECDDPCVCGGGRPCTCAREELRAAWLDFSAQTRARMDNSMQGLSQLVRTLAGVPGRKAILYAGSGLEQRPGLDALYYVMELCPQNATDLQYEIAALDETAVFLDLTAHANANRVTLYPIDAGGARPALASSVEWADRKFRPSNQVGQIRYANLQEPLHILAERTGGRAIFNTNQPADELLRIADELPATYSLGFEPSHPVDGRTHRLLVKLTQPRSGVTLRYRRSFRDRSLEDQLLDRVVATLTLGTGDNPLGLQAEVGTTEARGRRNWNVPVQLKIPRSGLEEIQSDPFSGTSDLTILLSARDERGGFSTTGQKTVTVAIPEDAAEAQLTVNMELRSGRYWIAVGAREESSGVMAFARVEATVPQP